MAFGGKLTRLRLSERMSLLTTVFLTAILLSCLLAPVSADVLAWSALENSLGWTKALGNWPTFDSAVVHSGANSMKFANSGDRITLSPAATSGTVVLRFWFNDADTSSVGGTAPYIDMRGGGTSSFLGFALNTFSGYDISKYQIRGGSTQGSTAYSNGAVTRTLGWHRIELIYKEYSPTDHHYTVAVDSATAFTGAAFTGSASFGQITVCNGTGNNACTPQFRLDTLALLGDPRKLTFTTAGGASGQVTVALTTPAGLQTGSLAAAHTDGYYDAAEQLTITAPTVPSFTFSGWTSSCGGTFGNTTAATTTYTGPTSDGTITANYVPNGCVLTFHDDPAGSVATFTPASGSVESAGSSVAVSASLQPNYTFTKWTTDAAGSNVISLAQSFTYTMPTSSVTLYCWSTPSTHTLITATGNGGTVSGDSGARAYNSSCTVTATASAHFRFVCWSLTADGTSPVSDKPSYTFSMPANDYTLYAVFAKALFYDGFDAHATGTLDSNSSAGANKSANGDMNGNAWSGPYPDNMAVVVSGGATTNSGSKMCTALAGKANCQNVVNVAYRCNGGTPLTSNFLFDWYFYDPKGSGTGSNTYNDYAALCLYPSSVMTGASDYVSVNAEKDTAATQRIAVGAWGGDYTKYQIGVSSAGGSMNWTNTSLVRTIGWHHGRIAVGSANAISMYIDDMLTPVSSLTAGGGGFNAIEVLGRGISSSNTAGYFDDLALLVPGTQSIDKWLTIGHYSNYDQASRMTTDYFAPSGTTEANIAPWAGQTFNGKTWTQCNGGVVNWNQIYGTTATYGASYLFTYINNSGTAITDADLTCGSDDGIKIWLNGSVVVNRDVYRTISLDTDRYGPFTLPTGTSRLLVKVTQATNDYRGQVRLTHADGTPLAGVSCFTTESTPPTGSVVINGGAATTTSQNVTLTLSATDTQSGVATMSFSNDNSIWSTPEAYSSTKAWTLPLGNGTKTVYAKFADYCGNSTVTSDTIQLTVAGYTLMVAANPSTGGSTAGSGVHQPGDTCQASATANSGYMFVGWSTDPAGASIVSTANPYNFLMPAGDYTVYAQFSHNGYALSVHANAGGYLGADPSGSHYYGESITAIAIPNPGFCFAGWTAASDGSGTPESSAMAYAFSMPGATKTLYANFAAQSSDTWTEDFERYVAGDISMNGTPNWAQNGNVLPTPFATNPWFGCDPVDCQVVIDSTSPVADSGSKMLSVASGADAQNTVNLAYRLNSGRAYSQNVFLDWYFYDPSGSGSGSSYRDFAGLASYPNNPILGASGSGADYDLSSSSYATSKSFQRFWQQFAGIGASWDTSAGYDSTKYQIHVGPYSGATIAGSYSAGWFNTSVVRSIGWHHARVAVGPVKASIGTNDISFYIDDMSSPAAVKDSTASVGFNAASVLMKPSGYVSGYMDDFSFGPLLSAPTAAAPVAGEGWIQWNWSVSPSVQYGSRMYDAATAGALIQDISGKATSWIETGLMSNTQYRRWVSAYAATEGPRTALTAYTLALSPNNPGVYLYTPADSYSFYTPETWPGVAMLTPGFGDGPGLISKMKFKWSISPVDTLAEGEGSDWLDGVLADVPQITPPAVEPIGTYYLYLRSYNTAGSGNPDVGRLGPFNFGSDPNMHMITILNCDDEAGNPWGPGTAVAGAQITLHANPKPGYSFKNWTSLDGGCDAGDPYILSSLENYTLTMPDSDFYVFANYTVNHYHLTTSACSGGSVTPGGTFSTGEPVSVTATPSPGFRFLNWTRDACQGTDVVSTDAAYSFNMTPRDVTLYANFEATPQLTLHALPAAGGTVTGGGMHIIGESVSISASPSSGYKFVGWAPDAKGLNILSTSASYNYTMPATDADLYAVFAGADLIFEDSFENGMGAWTNTSTGGSPSVVSDQHNLGGHSLRLDDIGIRELYIGSVATGPFAFRFWMKDPGPGTTRSNLIYADVRNGAWGLPILGIGPATGAAYYQSRGPSTSYADMPLATRIVGSTGNDVWNRVDIASDGTGTVRYYVNGMLTKTMTGMSPAQIDRICLGNGSSAGTMAATYFDDVALFANPRVLTAAVSPAGSGTVSAAQNGSTLKGSATGCYYEREPVRLTATPAAGYTFVKWTDGEGNTISTSTTCDLQMPGADLNLTAVFEGSLNVLLTVEKNIAAAGEVSGGGYYSIGGSATATATANPGYTFVKWSSNAAGTDQLSTSPQYSFVVSGTMTVYAIYAAAGPVDPPGCISLSKISDCWPLANDSTVYGLHDSSAKTVSATWTDGFWISETNRSAGIRVRASDGTCYYFDDSTKSAIEPGDVVDIYGTLSAPAGSDRVFTVSYVRDRTVGAGITIRPLVMIQRSLIGHGASATTPGLPNGQGLYCAGLLVRTAGTMVGTPGTSSFFLDDSTYAPGTGVEVVCGGLPVPSSGYRAVTGVAGMLANQPVIYAVSAQ